jgi:ribosomal protein S18 acetylase RimI-like enzyme
MRFETVLYNDLAEIGRLQPDGWPDIVPEFYFYIRHSLCHPLKLILDDKIIGVGSSISFGNTCWLAHIIVDREYRNRGIGTRITEKLISDAENTHPDSFLLIATEFGFPVYKKLGFRIVTEYSYMERDTPLTGTGVCEKIFQYEPKHCREILDLDRKISGELRHDLLKDYLETSFVFIDNNSIQGFYMPGIGEGMILAEKPDAGMELMKLKYSGAVKAVLPADNTEGIDFLSKNGYRVLDTRGTRMIRGKAVQWQPRKIFSRIGGNLG